jgi:hypothetical protein
MDCSSFDLVKGWKRGLDSGMKEGRWVREKKRWRQIMIMFVTFIDTDCAAILKQTTHWAL